MPKYASERIAEELVRAPDRYNQAVQQSQELGEKQVVVDLEDKLGQLVLPRRCRGIRPVRRRAGGVGCWRRIFPVRRL
ncbi:hypothetical protein [Saccharopolyspora hattusasensis]|uniref:hypothetical protein n=1 Tax=Saccharopolyspora hattusasensis TaxID=1128679 RepID=UPI003D95867B